MTSDRLKHQCHRDGCDSEAKWRLCLQLRCIGAGAPITFHAESSLRVCDRHIKPAIAYLLSPANKERIAAELSKQGLPLPDFSSAVPVLVPAELALASDEAGKAAQLRQFIQ